MSFSIKLDYWKVWNFRFFRFEKRIYIPLPEVNERAGMFKAHLSTGSHHTIWTVNIEFYLVWNFHCFFIFSYSGADIAVVCREALLRPIRRLSSATHFKRVRSHIFLIYCYILCFSFRYPIQNQMVLVISGFLVHQVILLRKKWH